MKDMGDSTPLMKDSTCHCICGNPLADLGDCSEMPVLIIVLEAQDGSYIRSNI
jgi:hypothetical protein